MLLIANASLYKPLPTAPMKISIKFLWLAVLRLRIFAFAQDKPKLTLDEFFNSVSFTSVAISPDGNSVVIATERADWDQQIFRRPLALSRGSTKRERCQTHHR